MTNTTNYSITNTALVIGHQRQGSNVYGLEGSLDEIRITKGIGRYTSNYTPAAAPFPDE
jgi:hypothetical protein